MQIYKNELDIADLILENQSVACEALAESILIEDLPNHIKASIYSDVPNTEDLFFTKSILVTTNLNKNDDYFDPIETWAARKTPVDKPMDIEHDHKRIVGHITSVWAIDSENNILADDIKLDELPETFHLCNASVVYVKLQDEELQSQAEELIKDIKDGKYFVSMEAYFKNFSFLLIKGSEKKILERNDKTSFLTKKLRAYGGEGEYDGYKVGRILKNIQFSGAGYVRRPANPQSVILSHGTENFSNFSGINENSKNIGVYSNCNEENVMSDNILEKQIAELKDALKAVQAENKELGDKLANANVEKLQSEIESLKAQVADADAKVEDEKKSTETLTKANEALTKELESVKAEYEKVQSAMNEVKSAAIKASRTQKLKDAGLPEAEAQTKAESLAALTDEQFDAVASALSLVKPAPKTEDEKATQADADLSQAQEEETDEIDATASDSDSSDEVQELMELVAAHYDEKLVSKEKK